MFKPLAEALTALAKAAKALCEAKITDLLHSSESCGRLATKQDLKELECKIMSAISEFAAKQKTFNQRQAAAIDGAVASVTALTADIKVLNDKITELQNSPGAVTPEDQALITELETDGEAVAAKAEAVATALKALDEQTPPTPPVA